MESRDFTGATRVRLRYGIVSVVDILLFLVVNSLYEEAFVAGYLIEASKGATLAHAVSISTLVRLLYHTYQGPAALASIVCGVGLRPAFGSPQGRPKAGRRPTLHDGIIFGAVYARYRNLWPLIVAHTAINLFGWGRQ